LVSCSPLIENIIPTERAKQTPGLPDSPSTFSDANQLVGVSACGAEELDQMPVSTERETKLLRQLERDVVVVRNLEVKSGQILGKRSFKPCEQIRSDAGSAVVLFDKHLVNLDNVSTVFIAPKEDKNAVSDNFSLAFYDNQSAFIRFFQKLPVRQFDGGADVLSMRVGCVELFDHRLNEGKIRLRALAEENINCWFRIHRNIIALTTGPGVAGLTRDAASRGECE
jgi:hypothetical protein